MSLRSRQKNEERVIFFDRRVGLVQPLLSASLSFERVVVMVWESNVISGHCGLKANFEDLYFHFTATSKNISTLIISYVGRHVAVST